MRNVSSPLGFVLPHSPVPPPPHSSPHPHPSPWGGGAWKMGKFLPAETLWVPMLGQYVKNALFRAILGWGWTPKSPPPKKKKTSLGTFSKNRGKVFLQLGKLEFKSTFLSQPFEKFPVLKGFSSYFLLKCKKERLESRSAISWMIFFCEQEQVFLNLFRSVGPSVQNLRGFFPANAELSFVTKKIYLHSQGLSSCCDWLHEHSFKKYNTFVLNAPRYFCPNIFWGQQ